MSFLSPWFLAGLAAVALPLWLHLLERENPVRIPFSSLMFFRRRTERSIRHRRLRYLLLLASRLALLALLALAFARPLIQRRTAAGAGPARHRIIVLDTSFSMSYGDRWKRAQAEALRLIEGSRPSGRAQVIAFGPGVQVINDQTDDRAALRGAIQGLKPSSSRNSYGELGQTLRTLTQASGTAAEVHLISDFQESAMPARFADLSLPATATLENHNVAQEGGKNWCVESVKGAFHLYRNAQPRIEVTVAGFDTPAATRRVSLSVNQRPAGSRTVNVPESGRATVEFTDFEVPFGHSRAEVRIDGADALSGDDLRLVSFERGDPLPILFLHGPGRTRELLYYRTALEASGASMFTLQPADPAGGGALPLDRFAFVILSDIPRLSSTLEARLRSWVEAGGAALVLLGPSIALEGEAPLGPASARRRVTEGRYAARERERFHQVSEMDLSHPALTSSQRFSGVKFFRYLTWNAPPEKVLVRLSDGSPLLTEEALGAGRVMMLTSAPNNVWNDLPVHPLFVPFVTESARYLSGVEETIQQATVDSVLELSRRRDPRSTVEVLDPAGRRALNLAQAVAGRELKLTSTGFWEVRRAGKSELVAVNPDPRESNLRPMGADLLAMWKSTGRPEPGSAAGQAAPPAPPRDFWRVVLIVALLAAVIESILGNLHLGMKREVSSA